MPNLRGAAFCAALTLSSMFGPMTAAAQDVQLRSLDGSVTLAGDLIAYDGAYYRLDSIYGPLTIAAEGVACAGPGCPDLERFVAEARIAGEATVVEGLLPALLAGFAESRGMVLATPDITESGLSYALIRADGSPAARFDIAAGTSDTGMLAL